MELVRLCTELDNLDEITLGRLSSEFSVFNKLRSSYNNNVDRHTHMLDPYTCTNSIYNTNTL